MFSGIGGIDLASEQVGFETVGQCEYADYPTKVLEKHWPNVPRWRDVRDVTATSVKERGIEQITLLSAGAPCQPYSSPGKRLGEEDERHLWPQALRVVRELQPNWFIGENVAGFITMALDDVLEELEAMHYETRAFVLPACSVGAPHERKRIFIISHSNSKPMLQANQGVMPFRDERNPREDTTRIARRALPRTYWETHQPPLCGVDDGSADWMDRTKPAFIALGNAVVPEQILPFLKAITDIENTALL